MENPVYYGVATYCDSYDYCNKETVVRLGYIPEKYIENVKRKLDALLYNSMLNWIIWESFEFKICFYDDLTVDQKAELNRKDSSEAWLELLKEINEIVESYVILERQEQARFERPVQTALVPITSNTNFPAVQVVQRDIIWQDTRPAINAEGEEKEYSDSELAVINVGNTTQLDRIEGALQNNQEQAPAVDDRDKYFLSISDNDERRAIMRTKGNMKSQAIKEWEEARGFPFCSKHAIDESINRGKDKLHIPKKPRKQNNSKPKK